MRFSSALSRMEDGSGVRRPEWAEGVYWFERQDGQIIHMPTNLVVEQVSSAVMRADDWEAVDLPFPEYNSDVVTYLLRITTWSGDATTMHSNKGRAQSQLGNYCRNNWMRYHEESLSDDVLGDEVSLIHQYFAASQAQDIYSEKFVIVEVTIPPGATMYDAYDGEGNRVKTLVTQPHRGRALDLGTKEGEP